MGEMSVSTARFKPMKRLPPGDVPALVEATRRALADPAAEGWGEAAQRHAHTAFAPAVHAYGLVRIYEEAVRA